VAAFLASRLGSLFRSSSCPLLADSVAKVISQKVSKILRAAGAVFR
jgi:hypothetical protein